MTLKETMGVVFLFRCFVLSFNWQNSMKNFLFSLKGGCVMTVRRKHIVVLVRPVLKWVWTPGWKSLWRTGLLHTVWVRSEREEDAGWNFPWSGHTDALHVGGDNSSPIREGLLKEGEDGVPVLGGYFGLNSQWRQMALLGNMVSWDLQI